MWLPKFLSLVYTHLHIPPVRSPTDTWEREGKSQVSSHIVLPGMTFCILLSEQTTEYSEASGALCGLSAFQGHSSTLALLIAVSPSSWNSLSLCGLFWALERPGMEAAPTWGKLTLKLKAIAKMFGDGKPLLNHLHCQRGRSRGLEEGLADGSVQEGRKYINKQRLGKNKMQYSYSRDQEQNNMGRGWKVSVLRGLCL